MGATSSTGVSGPGTVRGRQKGSPEVSLDVSRLIGPRIVIANQVELDGDGVASVDFPTMAGVSTDYVGFATDTDSTVAAVNVTELTLSSITLEGTADHVVNYQVVRTGYGLPVIDTD